MVRVRVAVHELSPESINQDFEIRLHRLDIRIARFDRVSRAGHGWIQNAYRNPRFTMNDFGASSGILRLRKERMHFSLAHELNRFRQLSRAGLRPWLTLDYTNYLEVKLTREIGKRLVKRDDIAIGDRKSV